MNKKHSFDLKLERYLLGELPAAEMQRFAVELERNADLRAKLDALRADSEAYFRKFPHMKRQGADGKSPWWKLFLLPPVIGGLAFATALAGILLFLPKPPVEDTGTVTEKKQENLTIAMNGNSTENAVRLKGNKPALFVSAIRNAQAISLADGEKVQPGEEIQIAYRASGQRYGVILSVDAIKSVTLHFPETEKFSQALQKGNRVALPLAFRLDEKPGFEKFYFLTSAQPIPLKRVMQELARSGTIDKVIGPEVQKTSLQLKKE